MFHRSRGLTIGQRTFFDHHPDVYATRGETITCEDGHPICDMAVTAHVGDTLFLTASFMRWRQPAPYFDDEPIPHCWQCGCDWHCAGFLHFGDRWRIPRGAFLGPEWDDHTPLKLQVIGFHL
ncbi:hypothetical protein RA307_23695 [Xanthobacteraceae bacterium Astr-EGSB]|uniref:hypothetical protein n=1 Tax=Astrobacterium formosum TaxID=3069710 RepID=UPI0027B50EEE|nr:hypothetical protein [Xanthobacteraceae bacterium Astr-EGSB]